ERVRVQPVAGYPLRPKVLPFSTVTHPRSTLRRFLTSTALFPVTYAVPARAQTPAVSVHFAAQAVVAAMRVDPVPGARAENQLVVEEPLVMLHVGALGDHLVLQAALDLEGWTMPDGVLTLGGWGEGFNDKRHP